MILMVVPFRIRSGEKVIDKFGLLDNGNDATLIREVMSKQLGLSGVPRRLPFGNFNDSERIDSAVVTFDITTPNNSVNFHVNGAFTVPRLNATNRVSNWVRDEMGTPLWNRALRRTRQRYSSAHFKFHVTAQRY